MAQNASNRTPPLSPKSGSEAAVARWTKWLAFATIALTICTAALVGTAMWAIFAADRQSNIAFQAEIDSAYQNKIAAASQHDTREQLRAVIGFNNIVVFPAINQENRVPGYATAVNLRNFGGTRTAHYTAWSSAKYFDKEVPESWDFSKPIKSPPLRETTIAPSEISQLNIGFTVDELTEAANAHGSAVIWGQATYSDIFDPEINHVVGFCFNINPTLVDVSHPLSFNAVPFRPSCNFSN